MLTYKEILQHIKLNKHLYISDNPYIQYRTLDAKLMVVATIFGKSLVDVTNDFADI